MRGFKVKVVPRSIQVYRQEIDSVETVLLPIGLGLDEQHLLRQTIGRVGFLWISFPQVHLPEWQRREFWVGADRANGDKFINAAFPGFVNQLHTHHQILVEELCRTITVGTDPPRQSRQMNDDHLRRLTASPRFLLVAGEYLCLVEEPSDGVQIS